MQVEHDQNYTLINSRPFLLVLLIGHDVAVVLCFLVVPIAEMIDVDPEAVRRRLEIGQWVTHAWTTQQGGCGGGSHLSSALVDPWMDGRLAALGRYVTFQDDDDDLYYHEDNDDKILHEEEEEQRRYQDSVDRIHCKDLTYRAFVSRYMKPNRPVILQGLAEDWKATKEWTTTVVVDHNNQRVPNVEHLRALFGNDRVQVMEQDGPGFGPTRPTVREMSLAEYADYWNAYHHHHGTTKNENSSSSTTPPMPVLYLKDYKFVVAHPSCQVYEWPSFFRDDWLNNAMGNAYKFVVRLYRI